MNIFMLRIYYHKDWFDTELVLNCFATNISNLSVIQHDDVM